MEGAVVCRGVGWVGGSSRAAGRGAVDRGRRWRSGSRRRVGCGRRICMGGEERLVTEEWWNVDVLEDVGLFSGHEITDVVEVVE